MFFIIWCRPHEDLPRPLGSTTLIMHLQTVVNEAAMCFWLGNAASWLEVFVTSSPSPNATCGNNDNNDDDISGCGWSVTGRRVLSGGHSRSAFAGLSFLYPSSASSWLPVFWLGRWPAGRCVLDWTGMGNGDWTAIRSSTRA